MRAWLHLTAVLLLWPVATAGDGVPVTVEGGAVSYTHLTLPTILRV